MDEIGSRLRRVREALGMTQTDFAKQAGISLQAYHQYEVGSRTPALAQGKKLANAYDITLDYIYLGRFSTLPEKIQALLRGLQR